MNPIDPSSLLVQMRALAARSQGLAEVAREPVRGGDFKALLGKAVDGVNETQQTARALSDGFERGDPQVDLSEVMIAVQKASVSFQAVTQIRNKLVSAYQDIMNMPI